MPDELHEYFQDKQNCFKSLGTARKAFGCSTTTEDAYDQMEKTLGLMFIHCPEDIQDIVLATIEESTMRRFYHEKRWANENV